MKKRKLKYPLQHIEPFTVWGGQICNDFRLTDRLA